ncbi:MAG: DUF3419 family protein [Chlamydiia bacterium]|nr:DUF3419 family protein [Chlamydiia bacterium]
MADFFHRLSYSFGNEDWITENKALRLKPEDRALCITASGDRPLHLLLTECDTVQSIDANPIQNALLNLKAVAIAALSTDEYLAFLGLAAHRDRLGVFRQLAPQLASETVAYFSRHKGVIRRGIIYEGSMEKWSRRLSRILRLLRHKKVKKFFTFNDLEEQKKFVEEEWDCRAWRAAFNIALHPKISRLFINDPGLYEYVDASIHIGPYIRKRLEASMKRHLLKENPLLSLIFKGRVEPEGLPPYLTSAGVEKIRKQIDRLQFKTVDLLSHLKNSEGHLYDCFSLSDVASYISKKDFREVIHEIFRTARPGARFCIRQFLSCHAIPKPLTSHFIREPELEKELENLDKCFVYRFMVGTIHK